jgi:lipopolysaccharide cholinephosphotransferase
MFGKRLKAVQSKIIYGDYYSKYKCYMEQILKDLQTKDLIVAIWGYGLKGEAFLRKNDSNGRLIQYVIDMNETLHGKRASTGQLIIPYTDIVKHRIDVVLVMNKVFYNDIERSVKTLETNVKLIDVDILIENMISPEMVLSGKKLNIDSNFSFNIRELQLKVLDIMVEIDRICRKHNITYFLSAGTALGAVRHRGFIPWDEDMDIGMLREDYERFRMVVNSELGCDFYYQTIKKGSEYCYPFDQVGLKNTAYVTETYMKANMHHGLHVDIFPFDKVPENERERMLQVQRFQHYRELLRKKMLRKAYTSKNPVKQFVVDYDYYKMKLIPTMWLKKKIEQTLRASENTDSKYVADICTHYKKIMYFNVNQIMPTRSCEFENKQFSVPNDTDAYLTMMYDNYMIPPAEDKRMQKFRVVYVSIQKEYLYDRRG